MNNTASHTKEQIEKAHSGDMKVRDKLITDNMGLVWSIVRRFNGRGVPVEDLFQIGSVGLIKAVDNFDTNYDVKFSTYAVPMIAGEIKRFLRDDGMIKVSRSLKETAAKAACAIEEYKKKYGTEPDIAWVASKAGVAPEDIAMAFESQADVESINKVIYQGDGSAVELGDKLEDKDNFGERVVNNMVLEKLIKELPPNMRKIIYMRYFENMTQTEIAGKLGISQVQVSRLEKKILLEMRHKIE